MTNGHQREGGREMGKLDKVVNCVVRGRIGLLMGNLFQLSV